jgi:hypothetical protein
MEISQTKGVLAFSCSSIASSNKAIEDLELYEGKQNDRSWGYSFLKSRGWPGNLVDNFQSPI